jgi:hypothetical protein
LLIEKEKSAKQTYYKSRADWIRTSDPYVPNVVRYRAALLPEIFILENQGNQFKNDYPDFRSRVDWIRTSDHLHPMQVRYRAAPPPEPVRKYYFSNSGIGTANVHDNF